MNSLLKPLALTVCLTGDSSFGERVPLITRTTIPNLLQTQTLWSFDLGSFIVTIAKVLQHLYTGVFFLQLGERNCHPDTLTSNGLAGLLLPVKLRRRESRSRHMLLFGYRCLWLPGDRTQWLLWLYNFFIK